MEIDEQEYSFKNTKLDSKEEQESSSIEGLNESFLEKYVITIT
jgi:hypothetical protein